MTQTYESKNGYLNSKDGNVRLYIDPVPVLQAKKLSEELLNGKLIYSKIKHVYPDIQVVKKGSPIFSYLNGIKGETSSNEEGNNGELNKYKTANITAKQSEITHNISLSGENFIADVDGVLVITDGMPKILPFSYDGSFETSIIDNAMSVCLDFYAPVNDGHVPEFKDIIEKMLLLKIKVEIDENLIKKTLAILKEKEESQLKVIVAKGKVPVNGKDGWIECIIDTTIDNKPKVDEDGKIDFHNISSVISVKKDTNIAVAHQPIPKEDGFNVYGSSISAKDGKRIHIGAGSNAYISEEDENLIFSKIDGFITIKDNIITVKDTHVVSGDIDFNTGNIISNGSLKVVGVVKNGFQVKLSQSVDIGGTVVDAIIEAGEEINIKGGFIGTGKGLVKSGGDSRIKFVQNQKVYSRGSLYFFKEIVHSEVYVKDKIVGQGLDSAIIGGYTIAGEGIEVATIGNDYSTPTKIEVGYDYNTKININEILAKLEEMKVEIEQVNGKIVEYSSMKRLNETLIADLKSKAAKHKELSEEMEKLKEEIRELNKNVYKPSAAVVKVNKTVYPGVKIVINGRKYEVNETMKSKTFSLSKELEVVVSK